MKFWIGDTVLLKKREPSGFITGIEEGSASYFRIRTLSNAYYAPLHSNNILSTRIILTEKTSNIFEENTL